MSTPIACPQCERYVPVPKTDTAPTVLCPSCGLEFVVTAALRSRWPKLRKLMIVFGYCLLAIAFLVLQGIAFVIVANSFSRDGPPRHLRGPGNVPSDCDMPLKK